MLLRPLRSLLYTQIRNNCTNKCSNNCDKIVKQLDNVNKHLTHICALSIVTTGFTVGMSIPFIFR